MVNDYDTVRWYLGLQVLHLSDFCVRYLHEVIGWLGGRVEGLGCRGARSDDGVPERSMS